MLLKLIKILDQGFGGEKIQDYYVLTLLMVNIVLPGAPIPTNHSVDILGVRFDHMISFKAHVRGEMTRASQRIGIQYSVFLLMLHGDFFYKLFCVASFL